MPGPLPPAIDLSAEARQALDALERRHTVPQQVAVRARIIQLAAAGLNNCQIARHLGLDVGTVRLWRGRWLGLQGVPLADLPIEDRLTDAPRPGRPAQIPAEPICQIHRLACEAPSLSGRPISQWSQREIADEIVRRGILPAISPRHAARIVKKGI
jgi:Homeodomain-like domain-containing protein